MPFKKGKSDCLYLTQGKLRCWDECFA